MKLMQVLCKYSVSASYRTNRSAIECRHYSSKISISMNSLSYFLLLFFVRST